MDPIAVSSAALAVVALLISLVELRRARAAEKAADARATRTEAIANDAAESAKRSALAVQQIAESMRPPVWTLEHYASDTFALTNTGREVLHDVRVTTGDLGAVGAMDKPMDRESVQPGESIRFLTATDFDTTDDTIEVTWTTTPGAASRETWSRPLPANPTRP